MKPKRQESVPQEDLFRMRLESLIDRRHELARLARLIDWSVFDREFDAIHAKGPGQPPLPTRLMAGLTYLKHFCLVRRSGGGALVREPVLAVLLRRSVFPSRIALPSDQPDALAQAGW